MNVPNVWFREIQYIQDDGRKLEVYFTDGGLFTISRTTRIVG